MGKWRLGFEFGEAGEDDLGGHPDGGGEVILGARPVGESEVRAAAAAAQQPAVEEPGVLVQQQRQREAASSQRRACTTGGEPTAAIPQRWSVITTMTPIELAITMMKK